jgi:hypothetical protein
MPDVMKKMGISREGQALELVLQRLISIGKCSAEDKTCGECTKHDIEIKGYG